MQYVVVSEAEMESSAEKQIEARDEHITCGSSTKSSNSPLGVFAFLRFWRGRRLSEQPAGPYVNRRGRRVRSIFLLCLSLFHNNKQRLSVADTSRPTVQIEPFLTHQQETKEIHVDPLSQALTLYSGVPASAKGSTTNRNCTCTQ